MGHVFHPGHEELHGVTVAVEGASGRLYVGRYHERTARGVVLHDLAIHDPATHELPRADWVARIRKFGIPVDQRTMVVPLEEANSVRRLAELG